jgi:hypothetical protein
LRQRVQKKISGVTVSDTPLIPGTSADAADEHDPASGALKHGTELSEEYNDALSPIYDQLSLKKSWWILELLPQKSRFQKHDDSWGFSFGWNLGRGRRIPNQGTGGAGGGGSVLVHRSVKMRMEADADEEKGKAGRYKPKANLRIEPTWVD